MSARITEAMVEALQLARDRMSRAADVFDYLDRGYEAERLRYGADQCRAAIAAALSTETGEAEGPWCQPMNCGKHMPRKFIVRFEDADMRDAVFDDEDEAYEYFRRVNWNWNCYLFGAMPLRPATRQALESDNG